MQSFGAVGEMRGLVMLTKMEVLLFLRNPAAVFMAILLPSGLLLLQALVIPGTRETLEVTPGEDLRTIDFFLPVAIAVAITSVAITNYPSAVAGYREAGVLRRLGVTPVGADRLLFAQWMVSGASLAASLGVALVLAQVVFQARAAQHPFLAALVVCVGTVAMMAVGSLIAATAGSAQTAYGAGLLVFIACLFTAGVWTPGPLMSDPVRTLSALTPPGAMTQTLTAAWYGGEITPLPFLVMAGWAVVAAAVSLKIFRWV